MVCIINNKGGWEQVSSKKSIHTSGVMKISYLYIGLFDIFCLLVVVFGKGYDVPVTYLNLDIDAYYRIDEQLHRDPTDTILTDMMTDLTFSWMSTLQDQVILEQSVLNLLNRALDDAAGLTPDSAAYYAFFDAYLAKGDYWTNLFMNDQMMCTEIRTMATYMNRDIRDIIAAHMAFEGFSFYMSCLHDYSSETRCVFPSLYALDDTTTTTAINDDNNNILNLLTRQQQLSTGLKIALTTVPAIGIGDVIIGFIYSVSATGGVEDMPSNFAALSTYESIINGQWHPTPSSSSQMTNESQRYYSQINTYTTFGTEAYSINGYRGLIFGQMAWNEHFTIIVNVRHVPPNTGYNASSIADSLRHGYALPLALARHVVNRCSSFKCAIETLSEEHITVSTFFTVISPKKAVIIARDCTSIIHVEYLHMHGMESGNQLLHFSNNDWWVPMYNDVDPARTAIIAQQLYTFTRPTLMNLYKLPWGDISFPLRREQTNRISLTASAFNTRYAIDTACTLPMFSGYCEVCGAEECVHTECDDIYGCR
jgi:hypothetical protein